jgi:hypothetical protein
MIRGYDGDKCVVNVYNSSQSGFVNRTLAKSMDNQQFHVTRYKEDIQMRITREVPQKGFLKELETTSERLEAMMVKRNQEKM